MKPTGVAMEVIGSTGERRSLEFLFDSGMGYAVLPADVWPDLGLQVQREMKFFLTDGTTLKRRVGDAEFAYEGLTAQSPVVLGEAGDMAVMGSATLLSFGLMLHPLDRTLRPMR
ncbi:MAG: aspartyl protease [Armatimonadetes bacterium]|nr:aspartyl protease [Armatimonadota bacterium]